MHQCVSGKCINMKQRDLMFFQPVLYSLMGKLIRLSMKFCQLYMTYKDLQTDALMLFDSSITTRKQLRFKA